MTIWKKKRQVSGLSKNDMANELGLSFIRYSAIEEGDVKMPSNLIDKFNEIINRGTQNTITNVDNKREADLFWKEVSQRTGKHTYKLHEKMKEFNVETINELASLLGYKSAGSIHNYLQGRNPAGDEFKKRLYMFFNDEKNIQIPKDNVKKKRTYSMTKRNVYDESLNKYYEDTDFKTLLKKYDLNNGDVATSIGVHPSVISRMACKTERPGVKTMLKVKHFFGLKEDEYQKNNTEDTNFADFVPIIEEPEADREDRTEFEKEQEQPSVVRKYKEELSEIDELLEMYEEKVKDLKIRKKICVEVLDAINEFRKVEE